MPSQEKQDTAAHEVEYYRRKRLAALAAWNRFQAEELQERRPTIYPTGAERQGRIEAHEAVATWRARHVPEARRGPDPRRQHDDRRPRGDSGPYRITPFANTKRCFAPQ